MECFTGSQSLLAVGDINGIQSLISCQLVNADLFWDLYIE